MSVSNADVIGAVKEWASPILIAVLGMFMWRDLSELRDDVKFLVKQQSSDAVKISVLESDITSMKNDIRSVQSQVYRIYALKEDELQIPGPKKK
jgi:hypothetical protein